MVKALENVKLTKFTGDGDENLKKNIKVLVPVNEKPQKLDGKQEEYEIIGKYRNLPLIREGNELEYTSSLNAFHYRTLISMP